MKGEPRGQRRPLRQRCADGGCCAGSRTSAAVAPVAEQQSARADRAETAAGADRSASIRRADPRRPTTRPCRGSDCRRCAERRSAVGRAAGGEPQTAPVEPTSAPAEAATRRSRRRGCRRRRAVTPLPTRLPQSKQRRRGAAAEARHCRTAAGRRGPSGEARRSPSRPRLQQEGAEEEEGRRAEDQGLPRLLRLPRRDQEDSAASRAGDQSRRAGARCCG